MSDGDTAIVPHGQGPDIASMARADTPVIWEDFRAQVSRLKSTAETLEVTNTGQVAEMKLARATRLTLKSLRVEIENKRKELGEEALRRKQRIDSAAKELREIIEPLEERMLLQEQFVERKEAGRKAALKESRTIELLPFVTDTGLYNLADMPDDAYTELLAGSKAAHEARIKRERKEREEAEAKAKAEAEERERIRLENERLKKEAATREAKFKKEREAVEKKADQEHTARQKAERELAEKLAQEKAAETDRIAAEKKAAAAPDKKKLSQLAASIRELQLPELSNAGIGKLIHDQREKFAAWIEKQIEQL